MLNLSINQQRRVWMLCMQNWISHFVYENFTSSLFCSVNVSLCDKCAMLTSYRGCCGFCISCISSAASARRRSWGGTNKDNIDSCFDCFLTTSHQEHWAIWKTLQGHLLKLFGGCLQCLLNMNTPTVCELIAQVCPCRYYRYLWHPRVKMGLWWAFKHC